MDATVIMTCYNAARTIGHQLDALARQTYEARWELVIADNGSMDATRQVIGRFRDRFEALVVLDASERRGQPHALNLAARHARSDSLIFCDADDEVTPTWLASMVEALTRHEFVACQKDCTKLNPRWAIEAFGYKDRIGLHHNYYHPYLPHTGPGSIGVKRWLHEKLGGFNEVLLRLAGTDFCFRAQLNGSSLYLSDALLHYRLPHTLRGLFRVGFRRSYYNVVLYKLYRPADEHDRWRWRQYALDWLEFARAAARNGDRRAQARTALLLGRQLGRACAAVRYRVPPP